VLDKEATLDTELAVQVEQFLVGDPIAVSTVRLSPRITIQHVGTSRDRIELPRNTIRVVEADVLFMGL
jgi:hypothetical protein